MRASELMTRKPAVLSPRATIADAWDLMRELEIRHVPVVDDGALVGMLSDRDLAQVDIARVLMGQGAMALGKELATPIIEVMSSDVISVDSETDLSDLVDLLIESRVGAIPVVRPDTRSVIGIVSYIDVLRALREALEEEKA